MATPKGKAGYKRTILLVNPKFQLTIMAYFIGLSMITSGIIFMANRALIDGPAAR